MKIPHEQIPLLRIFLDNLAENYEKAREIENAGALKLRESSADADTHELTGNELARIYRERAEYAAAELRTKFQIDMLPPVPTPGEKLKAVICSEHVIRGEQPSTEHAA